MKIAIGNDHAAVELKFIIKEHLEAKGHEVLNGGANTTESVDYPAIGENVGRMVASGEAEIGVLICGTGVGISIAANKVKGVRACVCSEPYTAKLSKSSRQRDGEDDRGYMDGDRVRRRKTPETCGSAGCDRRLKIRQDIGKGSGQLCAQSLFTVYEYFL